MSTRARRRFSTWATACLICLPILLRPGEAKAQLYCDNSCLAVVLATMAATGVIATADMYYTVRAYESPNSRQVGRNAIYWTSWQAGLLDAIALGGLTQGRLEHSDLSMGFMAFGTWPLSLTANGMWHAFPDSHATRNWAVGMVAFSDVALLSYDALLMANGTRAAGGLAFGEAFIGTLQLGFGIVAAARAEPSERPLVLSMTAIPAALATYGVLALALPEEGSSSANHRKARGLFASLPQLGVAPLRSGMLLQAIGTF